VSAAQICASNPAAKDANCRKVVVASAEGIIPNI
jgi:hypothetical protein